MINRPLVVAGPGARPYADRLRRLAERTNVGILNTWGLKGLFPWDSPFHLGTAGLQARDFELAGIGTVDVVYGIGLDADESPTALLGPMVELNIAGLEAALPTYESSPARPRLYSELAAALGPLYASDAVPLSPARAARDLALLDVFIAADPGRAGFWVARTFPTVALDSVVVPARRSPAAAVRAALSAGRPAIAITDAPLDDATRAALDVDADLVVEVWGDDGEVRSPEDRLARLRLALAAGGVHVIEVPIAFELTQVLVDVAGPVRAWTS